MCFFCHRSKSLSWSRHFPCHFSMEILGILPPLGLFPGPRVTLTALFVLLFLLQWKHRPDAWLANIRANYMSSLRRDERSWAGLKTGCKDGFLLIAGISGEKSKGSKLISDRIIILGQSQRQAERKSWGRGLKTRRCVQAGLLDRGTDFPLCVAGSWKVKDGSWRNRIKDLNGSK